MKIAVAVTGASGAIYAKLLFKELEKRASLFKQIDVVFSTNASTVWEHELKNDDYKKIPFRVFKKNDFSAPFASGSAGYDAMIICPCSMGTLGRIASGVSDDLITRAADVMLKERRRLILVTRETPYNLIHIQNMERVTLSGGIICPASPSFYSGPENIEKLCLTVIYRIISLLGLSHEGHKWGD